MSDEKQYLLLPYQLHRRLLQGPSLKPTPNEYFAFFGA